MLCELLARQYCPSAQAQAPRTSGSRSASPRHKAGRAAIGRWFPSTMAAFRKMPRRLGRQSGVWRKRSRKPASSSSKSACQFQRIHPRGRHQLRIRRARCPLVPGADLLADVATQQPIAMAGSQLAGIGDRSSIVE